MSQVSSETAIVEALNGLRGEFNVFRTQLFGAPDGDKPNGRIPLLEAASESHEKRLTRIERAFLMLAGAAGLLKMLSWSAESLYHIVHVFHP